jgi:hypothetical protein
VETCRALLRLKTLHCGHREARPTLPARETTPLSGSGSYAETPFSGFYPLFPLLLHLFPAACDVFSTIIQLRIIVDCANP